MAASRQSSEKIFTRLGRESKPVVSPGFATPAKQRIGGGYSGQDRFSDSDGIIPLFSNTDTDTAQELREIFRQEPDYFSPTKTVVKELSENGSPLKLITTTPSERTFVRAGKTGITDMDTSEDDVRITLFQTEESAGQRKKPVNIGKPASPADLLPLESDTYEIKETEVTLDIMKKAKKAKRQKSNKSSATAIAHALGETELTDIYEHSHPSAHSQGGFAATPVFADASKKRKRDEEETSENNNPTKKPRKTYITFPAPRELNSMRLAMVESPAVQFIVEENKDAILYKNKTQLISNKKKLVKRDISFWRRKNNNKQVFTDLDTQLHVTPARQIPKFMKPIFKKGLTRSAPRRASI